MFHGPHRPHVFTYLYCFSGLMALWSWIRVYIEYVLWKVFHIGLCNFVVEKKHAIDIFKSVNIYIHMLINILYEIKPKSQVTMVTLIGFSRLPTGYPGQHKHCPPWASCQIREIAGAHAPGMPGIFSPSPQVSDPDMHHGTCVTHVPWCMPGTLTTGFLWNRRRGKTFPAFPAHAQPAILRIW